MIKKVEKVCISFPTGHQTDLHWVILVDVHLCSLTALGVRHSRSPNILLPIILSDSLENAPPLISPL